MAPTSGPIASRLYANLPALLLAADVIRLGFGLSFLQTAHTNSLCNPLTANECGRNSTTVFPLRAAESPYTSYSDIKPG